MKILITNDDGFFAPGIRALSLALEKEHDVFVVAPDRPRSSCGHGITLAKPLHLKEVRKHCFSLSGFPADCILVGIEEVLKNEKIDLVVSGINDVSNLGQDVFYSGTLAGAREGFFRGIPSIAISLAGDIQTTKPLKFDDCAEFVRKLLQLDLSTLFEDDYYLNINYPNISRDQIAGLCSTQLGIMNYSVQVKNIPGTDQYTIGGPLEDFDNPVDSDVETIYQQNISLTRLKRFSQHSDTDGSWIENLRKHFS